MDYVYGAVTDVGITRDVNQDSLCVMELETSLGDMIFAIVCDGIGGFSEGELASATVIEGFRKWIIENLPVLCSIGDLDDYCIREQWDNLIDELNEKIYRYGRNNGIQLGTTAAAILVTQDRYYCLNIGDSRVYKITNYAYQITEDHSIVYREYLAGKISKLQVETDPRNNVLTRSIGVVEHTYADYFFGDIEDEQMFFLCTDGIHHALTEADIEEYMNPGNFFSNKDVWKTLCTLDDLVKKRKEEDNLTMAAVGIYRD